jgi:hypothetical protein
MVAGVIEDEMDLLSNPSIVQHHVFDEFGEGFRIESMRLKSEVKFGTARFDLDRAISFDGPTTRLAAGNSPFPFYRPSP